MRQFDFIPGRKFSSYRKAKKLHRHYFPEDEKVGKEKVRCFFEFAHTENDLFFTYRYHEIYNQNVEH